MGAKDVLNALQSLVEATKPERREIKVDILIDSREPAETPFERLREAYAVIKQAHEECHHALKVAETRYKDCALRDLADMLNALNQVSKYADDIRKDYDALAGDLKSDICARFFANPNPGNVITATTCKAYPSVSINVGVPTFHKHPEDYLALMEWLQVPADLWEQGPLLTEEGEFRTKVVDISYPGYKHMLERYVLAEVPLPSFITDHLREPSSNVKILQSGDPL